MNVYRIDTGAVYIVAAPNMGAAVHEAWKIWADVDDYEAIEDSGFSIERVEKKDWPKTYNDEEHGEMPFAPLVDEVTRENTAAILTCSEWP